MTHAMPDPEAAIRRALRAAAGELEPRDDGLERIQRRLRRPRPLPLAWIEVAWVRLSLRLPDRAWDALDRLATQARAISRHFMPPSPGRDGKRSRGWLDWARPLAAMGIAVSIVTAVVYMAIEVPQALVSTTGNSTVTSGTGHSGGGSGGGSGKSGSLSGSGSASSGASGSPSSSPFCGAHRPTPVPTLTVPSPSASPSASASTSPSPTTSPSPSPTVTSSASPTPGVTTSPPAASVTTPASSPGGGSASDSTTAQRSLVHDTGSLTSSPCPSASPSKKASSHNASPDDPDPAAAGPLSLPARETAAVWVVSAASTRARVE